MSDKCAPRRSWWGSLERQLDPQPRLRRRLIAQHVTVCRVEAGRIALSILGEVMNLIKPDRSTRTADVQPIKNGASANAV